MLLELYGVVFRLLGLFCHQRPERSFYLGELQFPLCIRCSAITLGAIGVGLYLLARRPLPSWKVSFALATPMLLDLALPSLGFYEGSNALRAATGLNFGFFFLAGALGWAAAAGRRSLNSGQAKPGSASPS